MLRLFLLSWALFFSTCIPCYCAATTSATVELPIFGTIPVTQEDDDTYTGTTEAMQLGAVSCEAGAVTCKADRVIVDAPIYIKDHQYQMRLEKDRVSPDLVHQENAYYGTIAHPSSDVPHILGAPLYEAQVMLNAKTQIFEITARTQFIGLNIDLTLTSILRADASLTIAGKVADIAPTWYPFAHTHLPERIRDMHVHDISIGIKAGIVGMPGLEQKAITKRSARVRNADTAPADFDAVAQTCEHLFGAFTISGTAELLAIPVEIEGEIGLSGGEPGAALVAQLPEGWHITDSFPQIGAYANGNAITAMEFKRTRAVVTSYGSYTVDDRYYTRGITIEASVGWDPHTDNTLLHKLTHLMDLHGETHPELFIKGAWDGAGLEGLYLKTGIGSGQFGFDLGPVSFFNGAAYLELTGEPSIGVAGSCHMKPDPDAEPLAWYAGVSATPDDIALSASMRGTWKNPFHSRGIAIRNLAIKGAQSYAALAEAAASSGAAALIPSQAGISGEGDITFPDGNIASFDIKANTGKHITSLALLGYMHSSISFDELIHCLLHQAHLPHDGVHMPHVHLEQMCLKLVPLGTYIGQVHVDQGIGASCYATIGEHKAYFDIGASLSEGGLHAYGSLPRIDIGPVHITGAHGKDSPTLDTKLTAFQQHLSATGEIRIGDIFDTQHDLHIDKHGFRFCFAHKLGPLYLSVEGRTLTSRAPRDVILTIRCTHTSLGHIKEKIKEALRNGEVIPTTRSTDIQRALTRFDHISIEDVYFYGSARAFVHGTMPTIHIKVRKDGEIHEADLSFNFRHPHRSVKRLAREIAGLFV